MTRNTKSIAKNETIKWLEGYVQGRASHLESFKKLEQSFADTDMSQIVKGLTYTLETDVRVLNFMLGIIKKAEK